MSYNFMKLEYPLTVAKDPTWETVDASKLNTFIRCPRRFFYTYVLGWKSEEVNIHLTFGTAFHAALEVLMQKGVVEENIDEAYQTFLKYYRQVYDPATDADNAPKNPSNALLALKEYVDTYQERDKEWETIYTEIFITAPIDNDGRMASGRLDAIRRHRDKGIIGIDFKTASRRSTLWSEQWKTSLQMNLYYHFLNVIYKPENVYGVMVDGIFLYKRQQAGELTRNVPVRVTVRKTNELHQAFLSDLNTWIDLLEWNFSGLAEAKPSDTVMTAFPRNTAACTDYMRLCPFHAFCTSWANPVARCGEPPIGFKKEFWNPKDDQSKPPIKHNIVVEEKGGVE